jgi:hypothetical protein
MLTIGTDSVRLRYNFHEDRAVFAVTAPTSTANPLTMWLGNFEALGAPLHNGKQGQPWDPIVGDRFFFPHPTYPQGIILTTPPGTPLRYHGSAVSFPIKVGEAITLRFATRDEAVAAMTQPAESQPAPPAHPGMPP